MSTLIYAPSREAGRDGAYRLHGTIASPEVPWPDPLGRDAVDDVPLTTTRRRLLRVAMVAAEAGARFAAEGGGTDAAGWMIAPSALFHGAAPIDACQERAAFCRATLAHGLDLGDDVDPEEVDSMIDQRLLDGLPDGGGPADAGARLFTCVVAGELGAPVAQVFRALIADSPAALRDRLAREYGAAVASRVRVAQGVDRTDPGVRSLLSKATIAFLETIGSRAAELADGGFDMTIEQRFGDAAAGASVRARAAVPRATGLRRTGPSARTRGFRRSTGRLGAPAAPGSRAAGRTARRGRAPARRAASG